MIRPTAIVFDYGGTLAESKDCKFESGINKLLSLSINPNNVTAKDILKVFDEQYDEINDINKDYMIEVGFKNYYRYIFEKFNVTFRYTYDALETIFRQEIYDYRPTEGMIEFLNYLNRNNIRTGVLSNNEFSGEALNEEIKSIFPNSKFEFVISSIDYCFRKPSPRIFEIGKSKMNLNGNDIWYAGNSFDDDIIGAANSDMIPVWYNRYESTRNANFNFIEVSSWIELQKYIESCNER